MQFFKTSDHILSSSRAKSTKSCQMLFNVSANVSDVSTMQYLFEYFLHVYPWLVRVGFAHSCYVYFFSVFFWDLVFLIIFYFLPFQFLCILVVFTSVSFWILLVLHLTLFLFSVSFISFFKHFSFFSVCARFKWQLVCQFFSANSQLYCIVLFCIVCSNSRVAPATL